MSLFCSRSETIALDSSCFYLLTPNVQLTNKMTYKNILLVYILRMIL